MCHEYRKNTCITFCRRICVDRTGHPNKQCFDNHLVCKFQENLTTNGLFLVFSAYDARTLKSNLTSQKLHQLSVLRFLCKIDMRAYTQVRGHRQLSSSLAPILSSTPLIFVTRLSETDDRMSLHNRQLSPLILEWFSADKVPVVGTVTIKLVAWAPVRFLICGWAAGGLRDPRRLCEPQLWTFLVHSHNVNQTVTLARWIGKCKNPSLRLLPFLFRIHNGWMEKLCFVISQR